MQEITCAIIWSNQENQYISYNLPAPALYTQYEIELIGRFEEMYSRSMAHSKKTFYLIEREECETFVCYWKQINNGSYTLLLRINEHLAQGKQISDICKALIEEIQNPKKSTFITKLN